VFGFHRAADTAGAVVGPGLGLALYELLDHQLRPLLIIAVVPAVLSVLLVAAVREGAARPPATGPAGPPSPPVAPSAPTPLSRPMRRLLIVLTLFGLVNFPDALLLLRAHDLGLSTARVIIAYIAVYAVGAYPAGALSDRLPRHLIFALGLVFFAAGYLGLGLVHASWLVFVLLPLYGGFAACTDGVGKAWVSSLAPGSGQGSAPGSLPGAERRRCAGRWVVGRSAVARVRDRAVAWRWHCGRGLGAGAAARRPPAGPDCTLSRGRCRTRTGPHLARPGRLLGVWDAPREPTAKRMQRLRMPDRPALADPGPLAGTAARRPGAQGVRAQRAKIVACNTRVVKAKTMSAGRSGKRALRAAEAPPETACRAPLLQYPQAEHDQSARAVGTGDGRGGPRLRGQEQHEPQRGHRCPGQGGAQPPASVQRWRKVPENTRRSRPGAAPR